VMIDYGKNTTNRLSRRYQLSENVRLTENTYPALFVMTVMNGGVFLLFVRLLNSPSTSRHSLLVYSMLTELEIFITLLTLSRSWWLGKLAGSLDRDSGPRVGVSQSGCGEGMAVMKSSQTGQLNTGGRRKEGKRRVPTEAEHHFHTMHKMWKTQLPPLP